MNGILEYLTFSYESLAASSRASMESSVHQSQRKYRSQFGWYWCYLLLTSMKDQLYSLLMFGMFSRWGWIWILWYTILMTHSFNSLPIFFASVRIVLYLCIKLLTFLQKHMQLFDNTFIYLTFFIFLPFQPTTSIHHFHLFLVSHIEFPITLSEIISELSFVHLSILP